MSNRSFGVEIECIHRQGYSYIYEALWASGMHDWAGMVGTDASLDRYFGVEVRSPILVGEDGFNQVKNVIEILLDIKTVVNTSCGLHVHHDGPEFVNNKENIIKLVKSWSENQNEISKLVKPERRRNRYCMPWEDFHVGTLESFEYGAYWGQRRSSLNLHSLERHGTIEIRQHEGSLYYDEIEAWVKFGQKFVESVLKRKRPIAKAIDTDSLLKTIKVDNKAKQFLIAKSQS